MARTRRRAPGRVPPGKARQMGDGELRDLRVRLGLHEQKASASDEPHYRRKPRLLSTGTPELIDSAVTNAKVADNAATNRTIAGPVDGAKLQDNSIGSDKVAGLASSKVNGPIPFDQVNVPDHLKTYEKLRNKLVKDGFVRRA